MFRFVALFLLLVSCSGSNVSELYSIDSDSNVVAYCAPFNHERLKGFLDLRDSKRSGELLTILSFEDIPFSLRERTDTYLQVHGLTYTNQDAPKVSSPLSLSVFNPRSNHSSTLTRIIDTDTVQDLTDLNNLIDFFTEYDLEIADVIGYDSVFIGVYDDYGEVLDGVQVILPPYPINPYVFRDNLPNKGPLIAYHPFESQLTARAKTAVDEDLLLDKIAKRCQ